MAALTKRTVDAAKYQGNPEQTRRDFRWDDKVPGFGLRVYPSGKRSFVVQYRTRGGTVRLLTLGQYPILTVEQARERAKKELAKVAEGLDPMEERRTVRQGDTVREFSEKFRTDHKKSLRTGKPLREKTKKEYARKLDLHVLPLIGFKKLVEVTVEDVRRIRNRLSDRPYEANRTLELVRLMFNLARKWGHVPKDHINPCLDDEPDAETDRERWVKPEELPRLVKAIDEDESLYVRAALKLYLLLGLRKNELLQLEWENVHLDRAEIRLVETKTDPRTVPLSAPAVEILASLPRVKDNPYVFPGNRKRRPLVNISKPWERIRKRAKLDDVTLHDLRRTVGSMMATGGTSTAIVGKVLGHASPAATKVYARIADKAAREALDRHAEQIAPILNGKIAPSDQKTGRSKGRTRRKATDDRERRIAELEAELTALRGGA